MDPMTPRRLPLLLPALIALAISLAAPGAVVPAQAAPDTAVSSAAPEEATAEPAPGAEADREESRRVRANVPEVSFGSGRVVIRENEYHPRDLVILGGTLEMHGEVDGDIVLLGSRATISGRVGRGVVGVGSRIDFLPGAHVGREVVNVFGRAEIGEGVVIEREFINLPFFDLSVFASGRSILWFLVFLFFWIKVLKIAGLFLAVVILAAILANRISFAADVLPSAWGRSFLYGLLIYVFTIIACIVLSVTVIGIPLAIMVGLGLKVLTWMGLTAVFCATGRQVGTNLFGRSLSYFGAILTGFFVFALVYFIPFFGGLVIGILGVIGIGLMTITRLGTRVPGAEIPLAPGPPPPPSGPAPSPPPGAAGGTGGP